jgi:hypothetical protein
MKNTMKILFCLLLLFLSSVSTFANEPKRLAVMISATWGADEAMHNDLMAMHQALRQRGLRDNEILSLEGKLDRNIILGFLNEIGKDVATWREGEIFLYYTGHGSLEGKNAKEAIVGLQLSMQEKVSWNEIFTALRITPKVRLILLPDS